MCRTHSLMSTMRETFAREMRSPFTWPRTRGGCGQDVTFIFQISRRGGGPRAAPPLYETLFLTVSVYRAYRACIQTVLCVKLCCTSTVMPLNAVDSLKCNQPSPYNHAMKTVGDFDCIKCFPKH